MRDELVVHHVILPVGNQFAAQHGKFVLPYFIKQIIKRNLFYRTGKMLGQILQYFRHKTVDWGMVHAVHQKNNRKMAAQKLLLYVFGGKIGNFCKMFLAFLPKRSQSFVVEGTVSAGFRGFEGSDRGAVRTFPPEKAFGFAVV